MTYGIYAIKDSLNGFMSPIVDSNDPSAVRNFAHAMSDNKSVFYTHPSDFTLYKLGEYDSESGFIESFSTPQFIESGSTVFVANFGGATDGI